MLTYAILTVPQSEPGKLPPKADDAVVTLAARLGCTVGLGEVHQQVRRLAKAPNPLICPDGAKWRLTAAGRKEWMELFMMDCSRRKKALEHSVFDSWCEMENAVYQAAGCLHLLQETIGNRMIEESENPTNLTAAGIYHLSEATSKRLKAAFDSIHRLTAAERGK